MPLEPTAGRVGTPMLESIRRALPLTSRAESRVDCSRHPNGANVGMQPGLLRVGRERNTTVDALAH